MSLWNNPNYRHVKVFNENTEMKKAAAEEALRLRRKFKSQIPSNLKNLLDEEYLSNPGELGVFYFCIDDDIINNDSLYNKLYRQIKELKNLMNKDSKFEITLTSDDEGLEIYVKPNRN